jgi:tetratricopeptide (TPR) repeat protein
MVETASTLICGNTAVLFYNSVAKYHSKCGCDHLSEAIEFNKHAFALAQQVADIELQLKCLETEHNIAFLGRDLHSALAVVRKAREITRFGSMGPRAHAWSEKEAWAYLWMGNLSRALEHLLQAEGQLISIGMQGSNDYIEVLDSRADVLWVKSEYPEARHLFSQIFEKTSPTCSPRHHANALCRMAELDMLMGREGTDIVSNINAAKTVYMTLGSRRAIFCSWLAAELKLYRGETEDARAAFLECF